MATLTRAAILDADDLKTSTVPVPEWGGEVIVRMLNGAERDTFDALIMASKEGKGLVAHLVAVATIDEKGERLFTEEDIPALQKKSGAALARVYGAAMKLNRLGAADAKALEKN